MFRTVPLSIKNISLYTQQWYMSYRFADSLQAGSGWNCSSILILIAFRIIKQTRCTNFSILFWNKTLHVSHSSSIHHRGCFTVHTVMVHVIPVYEQLAAWISMELLACCPQSGMTYTIVVCTVK
jgi:hypothetical protein